MGHDAVVLHRDDDVADGAGLLRLALDLGASSFSPTTPEGDRARLPIEAVLIAGILAGSTTIGVMHLDGAHRARRGFRRAVPPLIELLAMAASCSRNRPHRSWALGRSTRSVCSAAPLEQVATPSSAAGYRGCR
ncbi:MAG: hypothetical protein ACLTSX_12850 [Collinsella sp.]